MQITEFLRHSINYTTSAPIDEKSKNHCDDFLFHTKAGDCRSFATAFVLLCRSLDIPARMVAGYAPGELNPLKGTIEVRKNNAHAWAEVFIGGFGWVPFDPTPGGILPARSNERSYDLASLKNDLVSLDSSQAANAFNKTMYALVVLIDWAVRIGTVIIVLFALILLYQKVRQLALAGKLGFSAGRLHPASKLFSRVVGRLARLGITRAPSDTPGEISRKVRLAAGQNKGINSQLPETVERFMSTYEAVYFGQKEQYDRLEHLAQEIKELARR